MTQELERLQARGELEVENILEVGLRPDTLVNDLRAFQEKYYTSLDPQHSWLEAVIRFREHGYAGLKSWWYEDSTKHRFVLGVLEGLRTEAAVELLIGLISKELSDEDSAGIVQCVNLIMSFSPAPKVSEQTLSRLREVLHGRLSAPNIVDVANSMYALREIGDVDSLAILGRMTDLPPPYSNARRLAMQQIRKRWQ
jgi:hypothetical protein